MKYFSIYNLICLNNAKTRWKKKYMLRNFAIFSLENTYSPALNRPGDNMGIEILIRKGVFYRCRNVTQPSIYRTDYEKMNNYNNFT
jgi:hypothetical protein